MSKDKRGWYGEPKRHDLSRLGVKTANKNRTPKTEIKRGEFETLQDYDQRVRDIEARKRLQWYVDKVNEDPQFFYMVYPSLQPRHRDWFKEQVDMTKIRPLGEYVEEHHQKHKNDPPMTREEKEIADSLMGNIRGAEAAREDLTSGLSVKEPSEKEALEKRKQMWRHYRRR